MSHWQDLDEYTGGGDVHLHVDLSPGPDGDERAGDEHFKVKACKLSAL